MLVVLIALAGAAGVLARHGLNEAFTAAGGPWHTMAINVVGSFLLGVLVGAGAGHEARAVAGIGFLGGFTTFSTFSLDVIADLEAGRPGRAATYVLASVLLGIAAAGAGWAIGRS